MSPRRPISHIPIGALAVGALALGAGCSGRSETPRSSPAPEPRVSPAGGGFGDSAAAAKDRTGAVFVAGPLKPGQSTSGRVRVRNSGDAPGLFTLSRGDLRDRPGPNGGRLSGRLELEVLDVTDPEEPAVVYTGGAEPLDTRPLGVLDPGASRTYELRATALEGQAPTVPLGGGDPYEGSSTRISFRWRAVAGLPATRLTSLLVPLDDAGPELRLVVAPRQSVLNSGRLLASLRCSEPCRASAAASAPLPGRPPPFDVRVTRGLRRDHRLVLGFPPTLRRAVGERLEAGRTVGITLRLKASDDAGNRSAFKDTIRLRPRR